MLTLGGAGSETVELLLGLLEQSPAINSLYLDWGVTNQDVKRRIKRLLNPLHREQLWVCKYGAVPDHAQVRRRARPVPTPCPPRARLCWEFHLCLCGHRVDRRMTSDGGRLRCE